MKKYGKIIKKFFLVFFGILLVLYVGVFIYVSINKHSIIKQVTDDIGKKMQGTVSIGDVELSFFRYFPSVSVLMKNVSIKDSLFVNHNHPFLSAKEVFARISILKMIKKEPPLNGLRIKEGQLYLYTDSNGYSNSYLIRKKENGAAQKNEPDPLTSVVLEQVRFIIDDRTKNKYHDITVHKLDLDLDDRETETLLEADANMLVTSLAFRQAKGTYLQEKKLIGRFKIRIDKVAKQLQFDSINIKLSGQPFNLTGRFDLKKESPEFMLRAHTRKLIYAEGKSLLPDRIKKSLSMVEMDKPLNVSVSIKGPLKGADPLIVVNWKADGTQLKTPFLDFEKASFTGSYTNEVVKGEARKDPNSMISINNFSADWHGLPLTSSSIQIKNLKEPVLTCDILSTFPLEKLNELIGSSSLELRSGEGSVNITYKGPIVRNTNTNSFINGFVSFKDGNLLYATRDVEMKNVNGKMVFKNSDLYVENLKCEVLDHKITMQGYAKNLLNLIESEPGKANVDWSIQAPKINLANFIFLLKGRKQTSTKAKKKSIANAASKIDNIVEKASFHVNLNTASLVYKKFEAADVKADISLLEDRYIINKVSMRHAGGEINMSGALSKQNKDYSQATIKATMAGVDVQHVFKAFDNFGQDGITSQNLEGKLTANIDATMILESAGKILPASLKSSIDFSVKNGALNNFEPVKKMQNIIFKKRDFDNIRFAELKDHLEIENREIKISRMEIQSTVFSFFVEGNYSLKGNTDLSIQVPLNNLKKRNADYNPENIGTDKKGGKSIFLRGKTGSDGNVAFKIDLFNKYKKEKESK